MFVCDTLHCLWITGNTAMDRLARTEALIGSLLIIIRGSIFVKRRREFKLWKPYFKYIVRNAVEVTNIQCY
jgi:hypothetical protein